MITPNPSRPSRAYQQGFSLIEILIAVGCLAALVTIGVISARHYQLSAERAKLRNDVATLNSAVKFYVANGGDLTGVTDAAGMVTRLKSRTTDTNRETLVGFGGAAIDPRLTPVPLPASKVASASKPIAVWDSTTGLFSVSETASTGIEKFALRDASALQFEKERETSVKYATTGNWVWDYENEDAIPKPAPASPPTTAYTQPEPTPTPRADPLTLQPPSIETPGGSFNLTDFPMLVTITNSNPAGVSEIFYSFSTSDWQVYVGPVAVSPNATLTAYAGTIDPDNWVDSAPVAETYEADPVELEIEVDFDQTTFTYSELGGPLMPGSYPAVTAAEPGNVTLVNASDIPVEYLNNDVFNIRWTFDGSDPLTSGSVSKGPDFADGFPGVDITLTHDLWTSRKPIDLKVMGISENLDIVTDSRMETLSLSINKTDLPPPIISFDLGAGANDVTLDLDVDSGKIPVGAYIYYTLDGTDPGVDADGRPTGGLPYTTPFSLTREAEITARTYAPDEFLLWFDASDEVQEIIVSPEPALYVGGQFILPSGTHRNISLLGPYGRIDSSFNPGSGANPGSVVFNVVRQPGDRILVGGDFSTMGGTSRPALVRMNPDGTVDSSFDAALE